MLDIRQPGFSNQGSFEPPWLLTNYPNDVFWSFEQRNIIRLRPNREPQIEITLPSGPSISSIGESQDWLWFSNSECLYFYQPTNQQLSAFPLADIFQVKSGTELTLTDRDWRRLSWGQFIRMDAISLDRLDTKWTSPKEDEAWPQPIIIVVESDWLGSNYHYLMMFLGVLLLVATVVSWRSLSRLRCIQKSNVVMNVQKSAVTDAAVLSQSKLGIKVIEHHPSGISEEQQQWLTKVLSIIESQCNDASFTTASAAKQLFISERSLQRKFKQMTGSTVTEAVNLLRLAKASKLLLEGASVSYAAYQCGFNDHSYFSQKFKQQYGVTPSQFAHKRQ
ncbi:helix-turn-helix domain-containing protein [Vibrio sp. WXL103]|uniref:helix-turn-helix domain-containing protein n=1 Tax=Vibrio sp. WXL103 TaxID=3450710 RepID=UPI003EC5D60F